MPVMTAEQDWLRAAGALTIDPRWATRGDPVAEGKAAAATLTRLAAELREAWPAADGGACACGRGPCRLTKHTGGTLACELATQLAASAPAAARRPRPDLADPVARYLQAVREVATAVYYCRRVQHPSGRCWFSIQGPRAELCGRVCPCPTCSGEAARQPEDGRSSLARRKSTVRRHALAACSGL
jgi:hypothetical protein